jgi:hypothetical protein
MLVGVALGVSFVRAPDGWAKLAALPPKIDSSAEAYDALQSAVHLVRRQQLLFRQRYRLRAYRNANSHEWRFEFEFEPTSPDTEVTVAVSDGGAVRYQVGLGQWRAGS